MHIIKAKSYEDGSRAGANILAAQIILKPTTVLGLATGSTPLGIYELLAKYNAQGDVDFRDVTTVNLDEYCDLEPTHEQSYHYFMSKNLLDRINIDKGNTHVPCGNATDLQAECARYDQLIDSLGGIDLQLLGIGHDGHIGFNEPGVFVKTTHVVSLTQQTIDANARFFANANDVPRTAITMGLMAIMQAKHIVLVAGADKKDIINRALYGPITSEVPASILQLHSHLTVITCE